MTCLSAPPQPVAAARSSLRARATGARRALPWPFKSSREPHDASRTTLGVLMSAD